MIGFSIELFVCLLLSHTSFNWYISLLSYRPALCRSSLRDVLFCISQGLSPLPQRQQGVPVSSMWASERNFRWTVSSTNLTRRRQTSSRAWGSCCHWIMTTTRVLGWMELACQVWRGPTQRRSAITLKAWLRRFPQRSLSCLPTHWTGPWLTRWATGASCALQIRHATINPTHSIIWIMDVYFYEHR